MGYGTQTELGAHLRRGEEVKAIGLLRKPLQGTLAENALETSCGALNIDSCRLTSEDMSYTSRWFRVHSRNYVYDNDLYTDRLSDYYTDKGRWPSNTIDATNALPESIFKKACHMDELISYFHYMIAPPIPRPNIYVGKPSDIDFEPHGGQPAFHGMILTAEPTEDEAEKIMDVLFAGAHVVLIPEKHSPIGYKGVIALEDKGMEVRDSIYFAESSEGFHYCSKASKSEREAGVSSDQERANTHPTVKPIEIMELCAKGLAPKSLVVDPFLGSGTTGCAMARLGHDCVGIELQEEYAEICTARIKYWSPIGNEVSSEANNSKVEDDPYSLF